MSFSQIWDRITSETDIKKLNQLADLVGTTQQYISRKKSKDEFSVEWAYKVARKYNLLTEWVMTGEGPKSLDDLQGAQAYKFPILKYLEEWLTELVVNEPYRREWIRGCLEDALPMFKKWLMRREECEGRNEKLSDKKIA